MRFTSVILLLFVSLTACKKDDPGFIPPVVETDVPFETPPGFASVVHPVDNAFTMERWKLGKRLFFDPNLSRDRSISCASCHKPSLAFADDQSVSIGVEGRKGSRNAPSLANVAYQPYLMREGGVPDLERQILVPIQEHAEFDFNIVLLVERLIEDSSYANASERAYGRPLDPFVLTRAISVFERSLISGNSPYDRYVHQNEASALTPQQLAGMALFFSEEVGCGNCHNGFDLTDYSFQNNGLYAEYDDPGRMRLTNDPADMALFKVPSLRNVAVTAPYMHDGSIETLQGVVEHYMTGGADHLNKSVHVKPLDLNTEDMEALIAFLESLTDEAFLTNDLYHEDQ
jgi:cytochrome c peroxidase